MGPEDWSTIKSDTTFNIEVPAMFWADGDLDEPDPILVSVRRKSADALGDKVSLKIDINEYVDQKWNGIKKLSEGNSDDVDVVAEPGCSFCQVTSGPPGGAVLSPCATIRRQRLPESTVMTRTK